MQVNNHIRLLTCINVNGAPGRIRTADTRFRRAVLYPLSYEGAESNSTTPRAKYQRLGYFFAAFLAFFSASSAARRVRSSSNSWLSFFCVMPSTLRSTSLRAGRRLRQS